MSARHPVTCTARVTRTARVACAARVLVLALAAWLSFASHTAAQQPGPQQQQQQQQQAFDQARSLRKSGQPGAAADLLGKVIDRHGRSDRLAALRGLCLLDDGRTPEARAVAGTFAGYAGREPRVHTLLGRLAEADGQTEAASAAYRAALTAEPAFVEASVCLIRLAMNAGQFGAAADEAERLERYQPELGRALGAEALIAHAQKFRRAGEEQAGRAIEKYQAALAKRPGDRAIVRPLLDCMLGSIRVAPARELVAATFTQPEDAAERHYYEGRCCDALADPDGALLAYRAALAADARHVPSLHELARLALEEGRWEEARGHLATAASAGPVTARSCLLLGLAELGLGNDAAGEAALRESVRMEPGNTKALYHLGRLLARTGRPDEGRELLARVNTGPK